MLYSVDTLSYITKIPHQDKYNGLRRNLLQTDLDRIKAELNSRIDTNEIHTSSWIPGNDWTGTPYMPIYEACGQDVNLSGMCFGLILWIVMMERSDVWSFGRYEKDGVPIQGITYFKLDKVP